MPFSTLLNGSGLDIESGNRRFLLHLQNVFRHCLRGNIRDAPSGAATPTLCQSSVVNI